MLSATIGVVTVDFEAATVTVVAIWESPRPLAPPPLAFNATNGFDAAPWEHLPDHKSLGVLWNGPGNVGNLNPRPPLGLSGGNVSGGVQTGGMGGLVDVDTYALDPKDRPLAGQAENPANANIGPGGPTKIVTSGNETNAHRPYRELFEQYPGILAEGYYSQSSTGVDMTMTPTSSVPYRLKSHDAVFGEYASKSLLLAANADAKPEDGFADGLGDNLDSDGLKQDDDSDTSLTDETIAASLDALQRERVAIDAVLAELHEVKLQTETADRDVPAADQVQSPKTPEVGDSDSHVARDDQAPSPRPQIDLDGGMVLLQPTGDANSSAYDLAAAYLHGLESTAAAPLGVEASVGMYQAFDVGTSQRVSENGDNLPLAQPATATGASVSAENAPAKKSEQPS